MADMSTHDVVVMDDCRNECVVSLAEVASMVVVVKRNRNYTVWTNGISKLQLKEAYIEYHNFRQRISMLVEDFTDEFDRLRMHCEVDEEEE
ncbi:hypothetical protein Tco_1370539 [Tanacetum coccineum]